MATIDNKLTLNQSLVAFSSQAAEGSGSLHRLGSDSATFDVHDTTCVLRTSEVFNKFTITSGETLVYSGRATVRNLIDSGPRMVCEVRLDESGSRTPLVA